MAQIELIARHRYGYNQERETATDTYTERKRERRALIAGYISIKRTGALSSRFE